MTATPSVDSKRPDPRALVVDDNPEVIRFVELYLIQSGFRVSTATTAEEAIAANPMDFDLVISDLYMPGKTGLALVEWIRERGSKPKIVLMSGHLPTIGPARDALAKADGTLKKPFQVAQLREILHTVFPA